MIGISYSSILASDQLVIVVYGNLCGYASVHTGLDRLSAHDRQFLILFLGAALSAKKRASQNRLTL